MRGTPHVRLLSLLCLISAPALGADDDGVTDTSADTTTRSGVELESGDRVSTDPPAPDLVEADPPQPDLPACAADALELLQVRGLTPAYSRSVREYRIPPPAGGNVEFLAAPCDRDLAMSVRSVPVQPGSRRTIWVGDGRPADVVLLRGWTEVARIAIAVDPTLPPPPPSPALLDVHIGGQRERFDWRKPSYAVPTVAGDVRPVTVFVGDPTVQVQVNGTPVPSGVVHHAWAPSGGRIRVAAYRTWAEVATYDFHVTPELVDAPVDLTKPGSLYVSGGKSLSVIDVATGTTSSLPVPNATETRFLAVAPDHRHLYVTGIASEGLVSAVRLKTKAVVDQAPCCDDEAPFAVTVTPDSQRVVVASLMHNETTTFDAFDLSAPTEKRTMLSVASTSMLTFRPSSLELWVSDFGSNASQYQVERPTLAFGGFGEAPQYVLESHAVSLPPSVTNADGNTGAGIAFLPKQQLAVATNSRGDEVVVLDETTFEPLARIAAPAMPFFVTADPASTEQLGRVFVVTTQLPSTTVSVFRVTRPSTGGAAIELEQRANPCPKGYPTKVVFGATPKNAWLLCTAPGEVVRIDPATLAVQQVFDLPVEYPEDLVWAAQ